MLEMIVFAVVLVIAQMIGGYIMMEIMMKRFMSAKFIKKYSKMAMGVAEELSNEMEDMF